MLFYCLLLSPGRYFAPFLIFEFLEFGDFFKCRLSELLHSFTLVPGRTFATLPQKPLRTNRTVFHNKQDIVFCKVVMLLAPLRMRNNSLQVVPRKPPSTSIDEVLHMPLTSLDLAKHLLHCSTIRFAVGVLTLHWMLLCRKCSCLVLIPGNTCLTQHSFRSCQIGPII